MLGASHQISKLKTMLIAISLLMVCVKYSNAEEASEHIHTAKAVMSQTFTKDIGNSSASFVVETLDSSIEFALEANSRLLGDSFALDENISLYKGKLTGIENSWARFTRVNGKITGAFYDGEDLFLVKNYNEISSMLEYNALNYQESSHVQNANDAILIVNAKDIESSGTCALHNDQINHDDFNIKTGLNSFDYEAYINELDGMFSGQAQADKEIQISLFADVQFVSSSDDATAEMLSLLNVADGIYSEQIGVQFVLTEVTELADNGTLTSTNATNLIIAFRNTGFSNPGVSHLFTGKNLDGTTVGIAYVGSLCRNSSVGVTQKYGSKTAIIFAHELGHNFGAPHDNQSGSACSSTPSGFIMNPNVNSGGTTFSSCSVERILPVVAQAVGNCIADVSLVAPSITSVANVDATIGSDYFYDSDSIVEADGTAPFVFSLDIAPAGMTISEIGQITWLPTIENAGANTVQLRVSNEAGTDIQIFEIVIAAPILDGYINFNDVVSSSFDDQDKTKSFIVGANPYEVELKGNTWRSIPLNYDITPDTVIQFDFRSDVEGEIQGIAFENDNRLSEENTFKIFGTQEWGTIMPRYTGKGLVQTISIPVGEYLSGNFKSLVFIMDEDEFEDRANAIFSNVIVFEDNVPVVPVLNFNELTIRSHLPDTQDFNGIVDIIEEGRGIKIEGNSWKKVILDTTSIAPSTVMKFDFKSESIGEIHGFGVFSGNSIDSSRTIQLAGTQDWGDIRDFTYTSEGEWQSFIIPIGEYLTTEKIELVFIMDNDINLDSDISFKNIQFITE